MAAHYSDDIKKYAYSLYMTIDKETGKQKYTQDEISKKCNDKYVKKDKKPLNFTQQKIDQWAKDLKWKEDLLEAETKAIREVEREKSKSIDTDIAFTENVKLQCKKSLKEGKRKNNQLYNVFYDLLTIKAYYTQLYLLKRPDEKYGLTPKEIEERILTPGELLKVFGETHRGEMKYNEVLMGITSTDDLAEALVDNPDYLDEMERLIMEHKEMYPESSEWIKGLEDSLLRVVN